MALIVSDEKAEAAAVFTRNVVQAAPIQVARKHLKSGKGQLKAILANAGNANCATRNGTKVALKSCKELASALDTKTDYILPASTGVIGVELDSKLLLDAIPKLVARLSSDAFEQAAQAILTTDTCMKVAAEEVPLRNGTVRIAGMTKGSGMIHPNMATTLGFILTDAAMPANELHRILIDATERSYNSLSVDGDMSTNDIVALLANGASKVQPDPLDRSVLQVAIGSVMESLAKQIARDGEGARKLIVIQTAGFRNTEDARKVARAIANSPLVKTAIAGSDPNWGRILSAAGYSGVAFNPDDADIFLQDMQVCRRGLAMDFDEADLKRKLNGGDVHIRFALNGRGKGEARFFTCDLTEGYIQINGSYRT